MGRLTASLATAGGLLETHARSEAEVITDLLVPLLTKIAHASSMALSPSSQYPQANFPNFQYTSVLHSQTRTEERLHVRGRKPSVDFTMSGHVAKKDSDSSDTVYVIPIEAKKKIWRIAQRSQSGFLRIINPSLACLRILSSMGDLNTSELCETEVLSY